MAKEKKEKLDMEAIHKESKSKVMTILLGISLFCVFSLLLLIILEDRLFIRYMVQTRDGASTSITNISYKEIAGEYVKADSVFPGDGKVDEYGNELFDYVRLTVRDDGTAKYEVGGLRDSVNAEGSFLVGKEFFYLLNNNCKDMVALNGTCEYPNCSPMYEFKYINGKFVDQDGVELIKR